MNDRIVCVWNETVQDDDSVIVVGDLTAGLFDSKDQLIELVGRLKGIKTLVVGNHDHLSNKAYREMGFNTVVKSMIIDDMLIVHKPATEQNLKSIRLKEVHKPKLIVHGHIHANLPEIDGHFNVAWDRHKRMINIDEIFSKDHD
jgi:calcineurin-like phosphoesterase family protein